MRPSEGQASVHTIKVTLQYVSPAVWRRLEVPSAFTLAELSAVLQVVLGWSGEHLHGFVVGRRSIEDEVAVTLAGVAPGRGDVVGYVYDYGDDWQHTVVVEDVHPAASDRRYPVCTAGEGLPPEEDTARARPGRFDDLARRDVNNVLAAGRRLRRQEARGDSADPVFAGLFPGLVPEPGICSCGRHHDIPDVMSLPVYEPVPDDVLAEEAARSPLVQQATALATWLGSGRPVTPSGVLELADAEMAVAELGLDVPVLPVEPQDEDEDDEDEDGGEAAGPFDADDEPDEEVQPLSALDLPWLHAVWTAAQVGLLIDVRDGMAHPGAGLDVWRAAASPTDRIEAWATLTAAYVRTSAEDDADSVLASTAPLLYAMAQQPVKVGALATGLLDVEDDEDVAQIMGLPSLVDDVGFALEDWAVCGVVARAPESECPSDGLSEVAAQLRDQVSETANERDAVLRFALTPIIDALDQGPHVQLTPLGRYGLARLLAAHCLTVPRAGDSADVEPDRLLDRLVRYRPQDGFNEAQRWVEARGDRWESALREVASTAAVQGTEGPPRRSVLAMVWHAAGQRVAPLLDRLDGEEWLAVPAAMARHRLGIGPEPTLAQRMWMVVDGLTSVVDEEDDVEDAVHDLHLGELLRTAGAMAAAAELSHPRAREILMISSRYLGDAELARQLRSVLANDVRERRIHRATGGGRRSSRKRR